MIRIGVLGDFTPEFESHPATTAAILLAAEAEGIAAAVDWVPTNEISAARLDSYHGLWASPGSPYRSFEGMLEGIRYARERGRPFAGT